MEERTHTVIRCLKESNIEEILTTQSGVKDKFHLDLQFKILDKIYYTIEGILSNIVENKKFQLNGIFENNHEFLLMVIRGYIVEEN